MRNVKYKFSTTKIQRQKGRNRVNNRVSIFFWPQIHHKTRSGIGQKPDQPDHQCPIGAGKNN